MAGRSKSRWTRSEIDAARMFGTLNVVKYGAGMVLLTPIPTPVHLVRWRD